MTSQFWSNDPTILFDKDQLLNIWPQPSMTSDEKFNAISRMVILLSVLGFLFTLHLNYLLLGIIVLAAIYLVHHSKRGTNLETFNNQINVVSGKIPENSKITNPVTLESVLRSNYYPTTKKNPMGNVLLTDIMDNPEKKAAAPSFNVDVSEDITRTAKKTVQFLNPGIKNTNKQLFGDLASNFEFDWCMWNFYPTANTRVTNDQGAYANYLYGNMPSARDGDPFALVQDNQRYILI